jgi:hypothetical protein
VFKEENISTYAKRILPRGITYIKEFRNGDEISKFSKFILDVYEKVKNLSSKPRDPSNELEEFFEKYYVNTPLRKLENVIKPWLEVFNIVKDLSKDSTLYIVTYGKAKEDQYL